MPDFRETKRRMASLLEAQGQIDRARKYRRQVLTAENGPDGAQQTETLLAGLDAEKGQYDEHISDSRKILHDLLARSVLEGEPIGRTDAAYRLQLANTALQSADVLWPLAPEANLLGQAFTCSQMNDFSCVRASFDAQRSLALPVSFYGAVFYKGVDPKKRDEVERWIPQVRVREWHRALRGALDREAEEAAGDGDSWRRRRPAGAPRGRPTAFDTWAFRDSPFRRAPSSISKTTAGSGPWRWTTSTSSTGRCSSSPSASSSTSRRRGPALA